MLAVARALISILLRPLALPSWGGIRVISSICDYLNGTTVSWIEAWEICGVVLLTVGMWEASRKLAVDGVGVGWLTVTKGIIGCVYGNLGWTRDVVLLNHYMFAGQPQLAMGGLGMGNYSWIVLC